MTESRKILPFPTRPALEAGVHLGRSVEHRCPDCATRLVVFRASWTRGAQYDHHNHYICLTCSKFFGGPHPEVPTPTGAPLNGGEVVGLTTGKSTFAETFRYELWIADDGLARLSLRPGRPRTIANSIGITGEQAEKISGDFAAIARAVQKQKERLRGVDRWHVRPCPDRPGIYLVRRRIWKDMVREVAFCTTEIKKPRGCEACGATVHAGSTMYREEKPEPGANPSWRDLRFCACCIGRVARLHRGAPPSPAEEAPPHVAGERDEESPK